MGCDIHTYLLVGDGRGGQRLFASDFYASRNYVLFSLLADVRTDERTSGVCRLQPRGFPPGAPEWFRERYDPWSGSGDHSVSHLNARELEGVLDLYESRDWGWPDGNPHAPSELRAIVAAMMVLEREGCTPWFVFWFDC